MTNLASWTSFSLGHAAGLPRVVVNPNRATPKNASWTMLALAELNAPLRLGQIFIAVQPEEGDEPDFISTGRVEEIDYQYGIVYASVDWDGFADEVTTNVNRSLSSGNHVGRRFGGAVSRTQRVQFRVDHSEAA